MDSALFHIAEVLYVATFAMGWFCRCCDTPTGVLCTLCVNDIRAEMYQLDISGFGDGSCSGCSVINGTYVLGPDAVTNCVLFAQDLSGFDPPVLDSLFPVVCTNAIDAEIRMAITGVGGEISIAWTSKADGSNNELWRYRDSNTGSSQPCLEWVDNAYSLELSRAQINFTNISSRSCNGNSAVVTTTAL